MVYVPVLFGPLYCDGSLWVLIPDGLRTVGNHIADIVFAVCFRLLFGRTPTGASRRQPILPADHNAIRERHDQQASAAYWLPYRPESRSPSVAGIHRLR